MHGMDVVPSSADPTQLFVYAINHRVPDPHLDSFQVGANSSIEVFKTKVGSTTLEYVATVENELISTPNDVLGSPDGTSFYVTNDFGFKKTGFVSLSF